MKAVLFDYDGVLVDSEREKFTIVQRLLAARGWNLPESAFKRFMGTKTIAFLANEFPQMPGETRKSVEQEWRLARSQPRPNKEMGELIELLHKRDVKIGVVTGSQRGIVVDTLSKMGVRDKVTVLVAGDDAPSKPSPVGFEIAIRTLHVEPADTVVIEDSPAGVQAAKNAGAQVYLLGAAAVEADRQFATPADLLAFMRRAPKNTPAGQ